MKKILADRTGKIDSSGIRKVFALAAKLEQPINFSIGQPDFDVPEQLKEEAIKAIRAGQNKYSQTAGDELLCEKIAAKVKDEFGWDRPAVLVTSGVSGGLLLAFMALVNPGDEEFEPTEAKRWERYPFLIEEDFYGNAMLFVEVEIAGEKVQLQLDTGSGEGLAIGEELWEKMRTRIPNVRLKKGVEMYPYIGQLQCQQGTIRDLELGDRTIKKVGISIFPDDSPLVSDCAGMLGMQYFRDTVMVLDFERELMWVKGSQS